MNTIRRIAELAKTRPFHPALCEADRTFTYRELDDLVAKTASQLRQCGVRTGDRVGPCLKDTIAHLVSLLAIARLGAVIVPMDWRARSAEKTDLCERFDVACVLTEPDSKVVLPVPAYALDPAWHEAVARATPMALVEPRGDWPFIINLSSGTTASAKGAIATHDQYAARMANYRRNYGPLGEHRYLSVTPLSFSAGRNYALFYLSEGATVVLHPTLFSPSEFVDLVVRHSITAAYLVPNQVRRLLEETSLHGRLRRALKLLISGADRIEPDEKAAIAESICRRFYVSYSTAMTGQISCLHPIDIAGHRTSDGRINSSVEVEVVDDKDVVLPAGEVGRLRVRGSAVSTEFFPPGAVNPGEQGFRHDWFYPGDIGRVDDSRRLYLTGREASIIIHGGVSIYPEEIEPVIAAHPSVASVVVVARPDAMLGNEVVAVVVPQPNAKIDSNALRAYCLERLTSYKIPAEILTVEELPRTTAGKIKRGEIAAFVCKHHDKG